jgi:hypothetical protein
MDCPNCKTYGDHNEQYGNANSSMFTVFPATSNRMVNYPAINFSGNMGSVQIPQSSPASLSKNMTGGASKSKSKSKRKKRSRCKTMKIKNVGVIYKKDTMNPRKDIRSVKKQLMKLTEISFPPISGKRSRSARRSRRAKRSSKSKSRSKSKSMKKKKGTRKQRGGTVSSGYSTGGITIPASQLRLANPVPHTPYYAEGGSRYHRSI